MANYRSRDTRSRKLRLAITVFWSIVGGLVLDIFLSHKWAWGLAAGYFLWIGLGLLLEWVNNRMGWNKEPDELH